MRNLLIALAMVVIVIFTAAGVTNLVSSDKQIRLQEIKIKDVNKQLEELETKRSNENEVNQQELDRLQKEKQELETQLQAKIEAREKIAQAVTLSQKASAVSITGSCQDWMNTAGITDQANAYYLIIKESGCNPSAVNPSSGACGIGQQLPCGKWSHTWNDPVGGMIDMQGYVFGRYGSWANAVAHSRTTGWY